MTASKWNFIIEIDPLDTMTPTEFASYLESVLREQWGFEHIRVGVCEILPDELPQ